MKYNRANGQHNRWYDVPILARLQASVGNASRGLELMAKELPIGPPYHLPEVIAFYHLTSAELSYFSNLSEHDSLVHLQEANSSLRRAGHIDEARCPLSVITHWHDTLSRGRSAIPNAISGQSCDWTSDFFRCCQ